MLNEDETIAIEIDDGIPIRNKYPNHIAEQLAKIVSRFKGKSKISIDSSSVPIIDEYNNLIYHPVNQTVKLCLSQDDRYDGREFVRRISEMSNKTGYSVEELSASIINMMLFPGKFNDCDEDIDIEESTELTDFIEEFRKGRRGEDHNEIY